MKFFNKSFLLLVLLSLSLTFAPLVVRAEDAADEVDEDAVVNDETGAGADEANVAADAEAEEELGDSLSSPFVKTHVLFVEPESRTELPGGRLTKLLVSFQNNGSGVFLVEGIEGSLRFPQDFSFHVQNFSAFEFNKVVDSQKESTFEYLFTPSETFSQRQLGLTVNLRYRDLEGKSFINTVFNETITIVDFDEGFDGETFFLYVFLAAIVVLLGVAVQHFLLNKKTKIGRVLVGSHKHSNGSTVSSDDVDYGWIPKEHLQTNKSPKTSPRQRNARNGQAVSSGNSSNDEQ